MLDALPKKLEYPPKKNDVAQTYSSSGFNQAVELMESAIKLRGDSDE